jgi:hypothetical protein
MFTLSTARLQAPKAKQHPDCNGGPTMFRTWMGPLVTIAACSAAQPSSKSAETNNVSVRPTWFSNAGTCPVDEVTWNSVQSGFDSQQTLALVAQLQAAAQGDLKAVKGDASAGAKFGFDLNQAIKENVSRNFSVSKHVTELTVALRGLECAILRGTFKLDRKAAEDKYLELITGYDSEKKTMK